MRELKACDLYGGRERVIKALTDAFRAAWPKAKGESEDIIRDLSYLDVSPSAIEKVMAGEAMVDYDLFSRMSGWLDLNIWEVVGEPMFDDAHGANSRAEWSLEMERHPMFSTGPDVDMRMYVSLVMIHEICGNKRDENGQIHLREEWWRPTKEEQADGWRRMMDDAKKGC
jgi:hypothetical protein